MTDSEGSALRGDDARLVVDDLVVEYPHSGGTFEAVSHVSFDIRRQETLGLVGESGCGKSTTGRAILQLPRPSSGRVLLDGSELTALRGEELRRRRPEMQIVFQDPASSLNPRRRVGGIVGDGLGVWSRGDRVARQGQVERMLDAVGLDARTARDRFPREFSGGQCQRIAIARALITRPKLLVCDEPVSSLDVSVQAQILNLIADMKRAEDLSLLFISHDLDVVRYISDRIAVMYLGKLVEIGNAKVVYGGPAHHYTAELLAAARPARNGACPEASDVTLDLPSPLSPPSGCRFRTRCPRAEVRCAAEEPRLRRVGGDQYVACHFPLARRSG